MFRSKLLVTSAKVLPKPLQTSWIGEEADICNEISGPVLWCREDPRMEGNSDSGYILSTAPFQPFVDPDANEVEDADDPWDVWWSAQPGNENWFSIFVDRGSDLSSTLVQAVRHFGFKYRIKDEHIFLYRNVDTTNPDQVVELSDEELLLRNKNKRKKP